MLQHKSLEKFTAISLATFFLLASSFLTANAQETNMNIPVLVLDEAPGLEMPKRFRMCKDEFRKTQEKPPTRDGLDSLQIVGSAQFSKTSLENAIKKIDGPVWIVDLRRESHGFVDGSPISWYSVGNQSNEGESDDNLIRQEEMLFRDIRRQGSILVSQILQKKNGVIIKSRPIDMQVKTAHTESTLTNHLNLGYLRLGVLDHHGPNDATVDTFIEFVKTLPPEAWLYVHCRGGRGRSTTFMVMYDMIRNAKKVSMEDIIKRQALIGGVDLYDFIDDESDGWKKEDIIARNEFIKKFYQYAKDRRGLGKKTWTEWIAKHK